MSFYMIAMVRDNQVEWLRSVATYEAAKSLQFEMLATLTRCESDTLRAQCLPGTSVHMTTAYGPSQITHDDANEIVVGYIKDDTGKPRKHVVSLQILRRNLDDEDGTYQ